MKKISKKLVSLGLAGLMLCSAFTGCGKDGTNGADVAKDDPDKEVTLVVAMPDGKQKDADAVVEAINKELETLLPNTKIEMLFDGSMADKWSLWMSTKKKIDLAHSGYATVLEDEVRKESYLALDDYIEEYAPTLKELKETYWYNYDNATIDGKLYAVPNVQAYTKDGWFMTIWSEAAAHMDLQSMKEEAWSSAKTTEKFWQLFTEGMDKAKAAGVDCNECINLALYKIAKRGYTFVGGKDSNLCYDNTDGSGKILDFYTTEEFTTFCKYMKTWADSGYVSKDILTGQWTDKVHASDGFRYGVNEKTGLMEWNVAEGKVKISLSNPANDVVTTNIGEQSTYWSVPFTSPNPARAVKFLDLLHSEKGAKIANLLAYGIEGQHYEVTDAENGEIKAFEYEAQGGSNVSYGIPNWQVSNMLQGMYMISPYTHEIRDYAINYYSNLKDAKKHVLYGLSFDLSGITTQMSQMIKNNGEYAESIYSGIVANSDALLKELEEKNKAAGQEAVMEALQKQADEYIAKK